jgi:hypothetical protein
MPEDQLHCHFEGRRTRLRKLRSIFLLFLSDNIQQQPLITSCKALLYMVTSRRFEFKRRQAHRAKHELAKGNDESS